MIITDHLNFLGDNPLIGPNIDKIGPRFPDMTTPYNPDLIALAEKTAENIGLNTQRGVYIATTGPSYETPAEIRFMRSIGADAVGMSTVPEVIAACHMGIKVLGISCITNMAAGMLSKRLDHEEVLETAEKVRADFVFLLRSILQEVADENAG